MRQQLITETIEGNLHYHFDRNIVGFLHRHFYVLQKSRIPVEDFLQKNFLQQSIGCCTPDIIQIIPAKHLFKDLTRINLITKVLKANQNHEILWSCMWHGFPKWLIILKQVLLSSLGTRLLKGKLRTYIWRQVLEVKSNGRSFFFNLHYYES